MSKGDVEFALTKALEVGKDRVGAKAFINQHAQIGVGGAIQIGSYQIGRAITANPMNDLKTMMTGLVETLRTSVQSPIGDQKPLGN